MELENKKEPESGATGLRLRRNPFILTAAVTETIHWPSQQSNTWITPSFTSRKLKGSERLSKLPSEVLSVLSLPSSRTIPMTFRPKTSRSPEETEDLSKDETLETTKASTLRGLLSLKNVFDTTYVYFIYDWWWINGHDMIVMFKFKLLFDLIIKYCLE